MIDLDGLGERTIKIDCDVIQADGGTRTASITGGFIALALALKKIKKQGLIDEIPLTDFVAAVSVGIYKERLLIDLNYVEDSRADMDMNVVMDDRGGLVEVQGTAEKAPMSRDELNGLLDLASDGIGKILIIQKKALGLG